MFKRKPVWSIAAVIVIIAVILSLTPARAWASDFLSLFRLEKVTVIQIDPQAVSQVEEKMNGLQDSADQILEQNLKVMENGQISEVTSLAEAAAEVGFSPRIPAAMSNVRLAYQPGRQAAFKIDRAPLQVILDALGADVQLPEKVDGKEIIAVAQPGVIATSGCDPTKINIDIPPDCTVLIQMPSPTVDAPAGLDIQKMGKAVLQLLGLSADEAEQLSQRIDWTSTLLLPVPKDGSLAVYDQPVDGVSGTLLIQEEQNSYTLLWMKDGIFYVLRGPGWATEAQSMAATLP